MKHPILLSITILLIFYSCSSINAQKENTTHKKTASCVQQKVEDFKEQPITNPPMSVYQYTYNNTLVYYISAPCCDRYTTLYDENCNIICRPSGGITGSGDGKCRDFFEKRTDEKLIWTDSRKHK